MVRSDLSKAVTDQKQDEQFFHEGSQCIIHSRKPSLLMSPMKTSFLPPNMGIGTRLSNSSGGIRRGSLISPFVLTFYRGEWCPWCNLTLRAYQRILPQIRALGASLVAVSPQTPEHSLSTVEKKELTFTVLSDVGNIVARKYRLVFTLEQTIRTLYTTIGADLPSFNGDPSWELPMPATFLLAQDGTVRLAFVDEDFTHRLEPATLLAGLQAVGSNGPMQTNR
jgi:peroxiredoxin